MTFELDLHELVQQLTGTIEDFEDQIGTFEADPKSAVSKSQAFISKQKKIISNISAFCGEKPANSKNSKGSNESSSSSTHSDSNSEYENSGKNQEEKDEDFRANEISSQGKNATAKFCSQSKKSQEIWFVVKKGGGETGKADRHLRSAKIETGGGFYTLYKCILCSKQFNNKINARRHVLHTHFKLGTCCPKCSNVFFNQDSLNRHVLKCAWGTKKKIRVKSNSTCRGKPVKVQVQAQPNSKQSPRRSSRSNKINGKKRDDSENSTGKTNDKERDLFKKSKSVKIKMNWQKRNKNVKVNATSDSDSKDSVDFHTDEKIPRNSASTEKSKSKAQLENEHENQSNPSRFYGDVTAKSEEPELIFGIERTFFV